MKGKVLVPSDTASGFMTLCLKQAASWVQALIFVLVAVNLACLRLLCTLCKVAALGDVHEDNGMKVRAWCLWCFMNTGM